MHPGMKIRYDRIVNPETGKTVLPKISSSEQIVVGCFLRNQESRRLTLDQAILYGFGLQSLRAEDSFFYRDTDYYINAFTRLNLDTTLGARVITSKKVIQDLQNMHQFDKIEIEPLSYLNKPIRVLPANWDKYPLSMLKIGDVSAKTLQIEQEWENQNWVVYKFGDCPEPQFDFKYFAESCIEADHSQWPCILAEWYLPKRKSKYEISALAQIWNDLIPLSVIPFNLKDRQKKLTRAFKELKPYIDNHQAVKNQKGFSPLNLIT